MNKTATALQCKAATALDCLMSSPQRPAPVTYPATAVKEMERGLILVRLHALGLSTLNANWTDIDQQKYDRRRKSRSS